MTIEPTLTPQTQDGENQTPPDGTEVTASGEPSPQASPSVPEDPEARAEYFREKFANSTREVQRLRQQQQEEAQRYQNQHLMLQHQLNQLQNQPPPPQPQISPQSFLTAEEDEALTTALEEGNAAEVKRLNAIQSARAGEAATTRFVRQLSEQAHIQGSVQQIVQELQAAPELKDPTVFNQLVTETVRTMQSPAALQYGYAPYNLPGVGTINVAIMRDKLKDHRLSLSGARSQARTLANATAHYDGSSAAAPTSAMPAASGGTFDASVHLTSSERSAIRKAVSSRGHPYSGMDPQTAFKAHWKALTEGQRKERMKSGAKSPAEIGKRGDTLWRDL